MAIESGLGVGSVQTEEPQEEEVKFPALACGGFKGAAPDAAGFEAFAGTGARDGAALPGDGARTAFGLVVSGRHVGMLEAGEK